MKTSRDELRVELTKIARYHIAKYVAALELGNYELYNIHAKLYCEVEDQLNKLSKGEAHAGLNQNL